MLLHIYFFLVIVLFNEVKASFNPDPTYKNAGSENINGTTAQISDDESMIGAGFADGTFKIFDIQVNELCSNISTANESITGSVWMPNFGPVTVDNSGKVIIWSTECQITSEMTLSDPIYGIGYFESVDNTTGNTTGLIALNFGEWIQEYDVINFTELTKYEADNNESFIDFLYYNDGSNDMLIASTEGSRIRVMNMADGSESDSFDVVSKILMMTNFEGTSGNQVLGLGEDNKIYRFTSAGDPFELGDFTSSNSIAFCPSTKEFALAWKEVQSIGVYLSSGNQQKSLVSLEGISQQIDCSKTYLISIDDKGYINVYTYEEFKTWIIGVIVGIAGGLLLLVIGVIVFIRLRRKWAREAEQEKNYSNKPKKYPRNVNKKMQKIDSMNMLQNMTLETTMRE